MNRNKICLNLKVRINYICKIFNHSLIQSFIPFLEFPECPHQCISVSKPFCNPEHRLLVKKCRFLALNDRLSVKVILF